jgi:tetratricopeptide (TPR) repeat protein
MAGLTRARNSEKSPLPLAKWRIRGALLLIALAAYANSFGLGLAQDSKAIVTQDARVQAATAENLQLILEKNYWWPKAGDGLYRPVTTLSFLFNYAVLGNGPRAAGYHAVNFLLHAVNVWLLFELALLLFQRAGPAFFAAALWAVHPIGTEAVTSIVGRADLLAAMAVLGGLLLYIRGQSRWAPAALFAVATAGVFAKESAAVLLGLMLLWDLSFGEGVRGVARRWPSYAAVAASLLVLWWVRHTVLGGLPPNEPVYVDNPLCGADFWIARWTAIKVVGLDLWLLVFPVALSCDRSFNQIPLAGIGDPEAWLSILVILGILAAAALRYRRDRLIFWLAGFFGIAVLPTANLLFPIGATMAERFLYLPSVAFAMAIAALLCRAKSRHVTTALAVLLVLYTVRTIARNPAWNDDLTLASSDLPTAPRSFRLHDMLAKELFDRDSRGNIDRVIQEEEASWAILEPLPPERSSSFPPTFLGVYYAAKADSIGATGSPLSGDPTPLLDTSAPKRIWYTKSLAVLLKAREILRVLEKAYDDRQREHGGTPTVRAANPQLYLHLANTYMNLGNYQDAAEALRYAKGVNPRTVEAYDGLSLAYSAMGDLPKAVATMEEKALVDGFQPATMSAVFDLYQKLPDGSCAFVQRGAAWQFNLAGCPRVKGDVCAAFADLAQSYREALLPKDAQQAEAAATQRYGCPAAP